MMQGRLRQETTPNRILARLSADDFRLLEPQLTAVDLPLRKLLEARNKRIEHIYFIEQGFASVVANGTSHHAIEVGIVGREGVTGLSVIMEADSSPHETYIQVAGAGQRLTAAHLRQAMKKSPSLRRSLLQYGHAFVVQTAYTALANGRSSIEERLARWILMAHDRADGDEVTLTHEFLALMLGVRRPGVTVALNVLEKKGLVHPKRGVILVVDRAGLEAAAKGAYGVPEAEFNRFFG
jgi:CRP-like cAMP-binding protein